MKTMTCHTRVLASLVALFVSAAVASAGPVVADLPLSGVLQHVQLRNAVPSLGAGVAVNGDASTAFDVSHVANLGVADVAVPSRKAAPAPGASVRDMDRSAVAVVKVVQRVYATNTAQPDDTNLAVSVPLVT